MSISDPDSVLAGTFLARAVYGGDSISDFRTEVTSPAFGFQGRLIGDDDKGNYDDDYRGYIAEQSDATYTWRLLAGPELGNVGPGNFTAGGLYRSAEDEENENAAEAMVVERTTNATGEKTLFLTFRGSDGRDAITEGQTFSANGLANYYAGLDPIITAAKNYVDDEGIGKVVVSGHSLGGTVVDLFALADSGRFAGVDLTLVSLASAGLESDIGKVMIELPIFHPTIFTDGVIQAGKLTVPATVDTYIAINHSADRVYYSVERTPTTEFIQPGLTPNFALFPNQHYDGAVAIDLPNIENRDVFYGGFLFPRGFGAEHNIDLYWSNVEALLTDPLYDRYTGQEIIMGVNDYRDIPDYGSNTVSLSLFEDFRGNSDSDTGERAINGTAGADYILGLSGNDRLAGETGADLISGGAGRDDLYGGSGNDYLHGGLDGDLLRGEDDNDTLDGGAGLDQLYGDGGDDTLIAGASDYDRLYGGPGSDRFVFGTNGYVLADKFNEVIDYNQGDLSGQFSATEGDVVDISALTGVAYADGASASDLARFVPLSLSFNDSTFQTLEVFNSEAGIWTPIARFSNIPTGESVDIYYGERAGSPEDPPPLPTTSPPGSFQISPVAETVVEDETTIRFTITRLDTRAEETVYVSTTVDRGSSNGSDYDGILNRAVTFAPGEEDATVDVRIREDSFNEAVETFGLIVQSSPDQPASQYLASASFSIIDDDAAGGSVNFTNSSNQEWITPAGGTESFDGLEGTDQVTLDLREWSSVSTSTSGATRSFIGPEGRLNFVNVEQFVVIGTPGNDNIVTGDGNDVILGGDGNDQIDGGAGVDAMSGGDGDDTFVNVGVLDIVSGGEGFDTVRFNASTATQDLTINLGTGQGLLGSWTGIEQVSGVLGSGNDSVTAGALTENLFAGEGEDFLKLDYSQGLAGPGGVQAGRVILNLHRDGDRAGNRETIIATNGDTIATRQFDQFERFDITATDGNDVITTKGANDRIIALGGDDIIDAGAGDDFIDAGAGNDRITGIERGDIVIGGEGFDIAIFSATGETESIEVDIIAGTATGGLTWTGIEQVSGVLGSGNDSVTAGALTQSLFAGEGEDFLKLDYSLPTAGLDGVQAGSVSLRLDTDSTSLTSYYENIYGQTGSLLARVRMHEFERFDITATDGNDVITTKGANDRIIALGGDDVIDAGAGDDFIDAGAGNDRITGIERGDIVIGGEGFDIAIFSATGETESIEVDIIAGTATGCSDPGRALSRCPVCLGLAMTV